MSRTVLWSRRKKDFIVDWFNGEGGGGQHRNKNACCCRIKDIETGIQTSSQEFKSASQNKKAAFRKMVRLLSAHYASLDLHESRASGAGFGDQKVRTYHEPDDRVVNHATGKTWSLRSVVKGDKFSECVEDNLLERNK